MKIGNIRIGGNNSVFVIAEIGANHNGSIDMAKRLILEAKKCGADCAKFQTYTTEQFCLDKNKQFSYFSQGKAIVESEFELFKRLEFQYEEWKELIQYCEQVKIQFLTTIQDKENLDMMLKLGLQGIKVGSDDFDYLDNIKYYQKSGLPIILSNGMSNFNETKTILSNLETDNLACLYCVSLYPTELENLHLLRLKSFIEEFPKIVWGFSDHTRNLNAPALAVALGAKVIEKHFTLDHDLPGPDHWFSMSPDELSQMVINIRECEKMLGNASLRMSSKELKSKGIMRRRIIASVNIPVGTKLTKDMLEFKRADDGLFVGELDLVLDKHLIRAVKKGSSICLRDLKE